MWRKKTFGLFGVAAVAAMWAFALNQHPITIDIDKPSPALPTEETTRKTADDNGVVTAHDDVASEPRYIVRADVSNQLLPTEPAGPDAPPEEVRYITINNKQYPLREYTTMLTPDDPQADQWWVQQTNLDVMWDIPRGGTETVLAVIDSGMALSHEEFADRWHDNLGESGPAASENPSLLNCTDRSLPLNTTCNLIDDDLDGIVDNEASFSVSFENASQLNCTDQSRSLAKDCNLIDDDGNGYVDDFRGWDFINDDRSSQTGEMWADGDSVGHGTAVAGVAAAEGNNAVGIAGVDWGTKILPIQAIDDDNYGNTLSVGRAIHYAIERGADVINLSLGANYDDPFVREAVQAATAAGIVVVAAAGNEGCDCIAYPARYPEVVSAGALNNSEQRAAFSSYGANLDIMAPGTNITSAYWSAAAPDATYVSGISGTSFAAPLVSGMVTRLISHQPDATPLQLIAALTETTDRLNIGSQSHSTTLGYGAIDAQAAALRMTIARHEAQLDSLAPVAAGAFLDTESPLEAGGTYTSLVCSHTTPTTPIYELRKSGQQFFTISRVEEHLATQMGYTSLFLGYACLLQPHDTVVTMGTIDVVAELCKYLPTYTPLF